MQQKIQSKVKRSDIEKLMQEQSHFNQFFCTEFIMARYKWKSGILLDGQIVPFNCEVINTLKQNFLWSKNTGVLGIVNGGLYEVSVGLFGQKLPEIRLILNEKTVFQSKETVKQSKVVQTFCNVGRCKQIFLLVQDNSQMKIQCVGEMVNEGFLNIKRL